MSGTFSVSRTLQPPSFQVPIALSTVGVGESSWSFKTEFDVSDNELQLENIDLVFEGLDTFASVKLVG